MSYATLERGYGLSTPFKYSYSSAQIPGDFLKTDVVGSAGSTIEDAPVCQCIKSKHKC